MSLLNQDTATEPSLMDGTNESKARIPDEEAANTSTETEKSQTADSDLSKEFSEENSTREATHKKKDMADGAATRPWVCVPCKKQFSRRRKLDQHNRLVHNKGVTHSCNKCLMTFSRSDHLKRHVKRGNCTRRSQQDTDDAELSMTSDDTERPDELSMLDIYICIQLMLMFNDSLCFKTSRSFSCVTFYCCTYYSASYLHPGTSFYQAV